MVITTRCFSNLLDAMNPLLTEPQVADLLQTSERSVRKARNEGRLSYVMLGRMVRYRIADVDAFVERSVVQNDTGSGATRRSTRAPRRVGKIVTFSAREMERC